MLKATLFNIGSLFVLLAVSKKNMI